MVEPRKPGRRLAPALVACAVAGGAHAAELTIDRLFDAPALTGPTLTGLQLSPDGVRVTYLQGKPDDKDRLDLWEYSIRDAESRVLVDSSAGAPAQERLSDEELNRRERQRTAALSGIVEYSFAPSGRALLYPLGGQVYYYDLTKPRSTALTKITQGESFATDASVSPRGAYVGYVRDQNVFVYDLAARKERALTRDGHGPVKNGMAEFVAQEEMERPTGYWWSPDDARVAFARVDESPVKETQRFEISADNVATFVQRYPAAGDPNVRVRLGVADVHSGRTIWLDLGSDADIYLARVNWLSDGRTVAVQRESRDQRRLELIFADIATGKSRVVLSESSTTWIDLNDELTFLKNGREFIWASARSGFTHLYLYDIGGRLIRPLTAGEWNVDDFRSRAIKAVDESNRYVYFMATAKSPIERQLYRVSLDTDDPKGHDPNHRGGRSTPCRDVARRSLLRGYVQQPFAAAAGEPARRRRPAPRLPA